MKDERIGKHKKNIEGKENGDDNDDEDEDKEEDNDNFDENKIDFEEMM